MLLAKVLVPVTDRLEANNPPLLLVMDGVVPLILSEPTVKAICKSNMPLVPLITKALVVAPKLLVLSTFKVPALMVVPPLYVLTPDKVNAPVPDLAKPPLPANIALIDLAPSPEMV